MVAPLHLFSASCCCTIQQEHTMGCLKDLVLPVVCLFAAPFSLLQSPTFLIANHLILHSSPHPTILPALQERLYAPTFSAQWHLAYPWGSLIPRCLYYPINTSGKTFLVVN